MVALSVNEVLVRARALIESPEKWGKGDGTTDDTGLVQQGCRCVVMAVRDATLEIEKPHVRAEKRSASLRLICLAVGFKDEEPEQFYRWHDAPGRTHADVMKVMDAAIALAEKQEAVLHG